ncbi:hypothetical protein BT67DRAFT_34415 [Trichocladium antarcticum]|uniref:Uncharacterized protein n=1 Tax=Trichocladium antarcticum TaxID=1450529 RepID=A0AAN6ZCD8_9PEZI|nr:hypothetical protein BT67DRAFT_34415 [Trichocladium antarcticum]
MAVHRLAHSQGDMIRPVCASACKQLYIDLRSDTPSANARRPCENTCNCRSTLIASLNKTGLLIPGHHNPQYLSVSDKVVPNHPIISFVSGLAPASKGVKGARYRPTYSVLSCPSLLRGVCKEKEIGRMVFPIEARIIVFTPLGGAGRAWQSLMICYASDDRVAM